MSFQFKLRTTIHIKSYLNTIIIYFETFLIKK